MEDQISKLTDLAAISRGQIQELESRVAGLEKEVRAEIMRGLDVVERDIANELKAFTIEASAAQADERGKILFGQMADAAEKLRAKIDAQMAGVLARQRAVDDFVARADIKTDALSATVGQSVDLLRADIKRGMAEALERVSSERLNPRGAWQPNTLYKRLDIVSHSGSSYVANEDTREKPGVSAKEWTLLAKRGPGGSGGGAMTSLSEIYPVQASGQILVSDGATFQQTNLAAGSGVTITGTPGDTLTISATNTGTVTSVDVSGGTTGLTTSGGPITGSGTITLGGTLALASGGTGATNAADARTALELGGAAVLNVGITAGTVAAGDDSRFTDARTPTAHASTHTNGTDDIQDATASQKGLATAAQITKLDGIATGANVGITQLTGDVTAGPGGNSQAATIANDAVTFAKMQNISTAHLIGRHSSGSGDPEQVGIGGGLEFSGANIRREALTGDVTASAGSNTTTLANTAVSAGSYGSATQVGTFTVDAKGRLTAASNTTIAIANTQVSGLGTMSTQDANNVAITGGSVTGITDLAIADGGTGASTAQGARLALLPTIASQAGKVLAVNVGETDVEWIAVGGSGTVTSVAASVPTGLTISGSPITTSGTLAIGLDTGYVIPLQATLDGKASTGAVTSSGITMSTARILGRTTASTGAIEEITVGSGLSLSAGTLSATGGAATWGGITGTLSDQTDLQSALDGKQPLDAALTALAAGSDFVQFTGPATSIKVFTLPNASATILTTNAAVTVAQGGTGATTLTGLLQGNGTSAVTAITNSSTTGQVLRVTGASTYAWGALDLGNASAITGDLPFANLAQGSALSVLGVTGNSTADVASIAAGTDHQVLRRSGTSLAFGAVALNQSAAVTGTLGVTNGGTGMNNSALVADRYLYTSGTGTFAAGTITSFGRSLIDDADNTAARTTLGLGTGDNPNFTGVFLGTDVGGVYLYRSDVGQFTIRVGTTAGGNHFHNFAANGNVTLAGNLRLAAYGAGILRTDSGGNVTATNAIDGTTIGATTPSTGAFTTLSASTSVTTPLLTNAGTLALSATGANIITASTNGSERMRIDSSGNVGIGTTSTAESRTTIGNSIGDASLDSAQFLRLFATPAANQVNLNFYARRHTAGTSWEGVAMRIQHRVDSTNMAYIDFNPGNGGQDLSMGHGTTDFFRMSSSGALRFHAYGAGILRTDSSGNVKARGLQSVTSAATVTPNADNDEAVIITAQAEGLTLANPSNAGSTRFDGQKMVIRIKDNGTARTIGYGGEYRAIGVTLPTTTVINKTVYLGLIFNSADTKWDCVAVAQEA